MMIFLLKKKASLIQNTLQKFNIAPENILKIGHPKRKLVFQPFLGPGNFSEANS